jgi:predicted nucleotidyltransferase
MANNPNILELLYLPEYKVLTELGKRLVEYRLAFLSKKVYKAYSGYAYSQLKKVETHRKWLLAYANNPDAYSSKPCISDYISEEFTTVLSKDELNAYHYFLYTLLKEYSHLSSLAEQVFEEANLKNHLERFDWPAELDSQVQYYTKASKDFTTLVRQTHNYKAALRDYTDYHSWRENRSSKRGLIESQCGYDGHHLHHCIRLMQMGKEILTEESLFVDRTGWDASFLLEVKQGKVPYEELIRLVEELKVELEEAYKDTRLPDMADRSLIEKLVIDLNKSHLLSSIGR